MPKNENNFPGIDVDRRDFMTAAAGIVAGVMATDSATADETGVEPLPAPAEQKTTVLVTGSNRGLGFGFVNRYQERDWRIIATCRRPDAADELNALADKNPNILVERLDVSDQGQIDHLAVKYQNMPIDILLNNAGIGGGSENQIFGKLQYDVFYEVMTVNAVGPIKMAEAFRKHVEASNLKKIIVVSSSQGSIAQVDAPMLYWYRSSKAAVNMLMANLALQVKRKKIIVGLVTPGATATDFIPSEFRKRIPGIREPAVAVADMMRNIDGFTLETTGQFFDYDGTILPW